LVGHIGTRAIGVIRSLCIYAFVLVSLSRFPICSFARNLIPLFIISILIIIDTMTLAIFSMIGPEN
jgi:hypothetical protein